MLLSAIATMTHLPGEDITTELGKERQIKIKEWLESYRPVRQRTVRSETAKDMRLGPCRQLSPLFIAPTTYLKNLNLNLNL